ncbi:hypothetical protein EVAR_5100_1 [Eumeta japonica]|uniref:Uncharacterized protein n=1 Tax=Eumeta variegata TaxID=151549 RepID=A0A4C1SUD6_EUMVA|nr:hypothetical protein EVAR_5100_1 [Eumeta japonica]
MSDESTSHNVTSLKRRKPSNEQEIKNEIQYGPLLSTYLPQAVTGPEVGVHCPHRHHCCLSTRHRQLRALAGVHCPYREPLLSTYLPQAVTGPEGPLLFTYPPQAVAGPEAGVHCPHRHHCCLSTRHRQLRALAGVHCPYRGHCCLPTRHRQLRALRLASTVHIGTTVVYLPAIGNCGH